eukprot:CAMPEP_0202863706 /NCGR_PEP_ID=MMETSP1391-20130828/4234_1 /ASSEMBLY_ACC=CAM_ASM_000867 /TAXON_ID=1034604 /ORGANISM="Chlamydomonas leiostraca, Strain SAG 11-49" /LENGTH=396 /DNA_ID=CAMNT_0049543365 /DNA_START=31 /DNA_END=1218 /DNA_ORIENTATION=+
MAADVEETKKMKFKVFVRLRPAGGDGSNMNGVCKVEHRIVTLQDPTKPQQSSEFVFDRVFAADAAQEAVFEELAKPLVEHAMQGYNSCAFAYGQTGSGKTFSMFGKETGEHSLRGVIPRAAEELFKVAGEVAAGSPVRYAFFVSFLEIYLEQVRDLGKGALLGGGGASKREMEEWAKSSLDVMEDPSGQTSVKELTYIEVGSAAEVLHVLRDGQALRATASTNQNDVSSRSHTVFTISVVQYRDGNKPVTGRLHLVDLAGSERLGKSGSEGQRLTEMKAINKSLTALGKVVMALSTEGSGGGVQHVPFRDSKLTRILKDSLQGNSMTCMLAALNPHPDNYEECFNTLQFAVRCQSINLTPHINVVGGPSASGMGGENLEALVAQVAALQEELDYTH